MSLWQKLKEWHKKRYKKRIEKMEKQGKCPECRGTGYQISAMEAMYSALYDCSGCNGSGLFTDWENLKKASKENK
ncbi:methionine aminopeptidase [Thalassorhabdus alkalitolerans]|uniref:Methionine aminopeptidase n=1 Tax=Thalassorhabdus alkalitolerans TaxID=2282697 RepID=A0ABW0YKV3_9BACI